MNTNYIDQKNEEANKRSWLRHTASGASVGSLVASLVLLVINLFLLWFAAWDCSYIGKCPEQWFFIVILFAPPLAGIAVGIFYGWLNNRSRHHQKKPYRYGLEGGIVGPILMTMFNGVLVILLFTNW